MEMNEMNVKNTRTVRGGNAPRRLLVIALGIVILIALVSGCSPRVFSMVMDGELNPYTFMLSVIDTERYAPIAA